MLIEVLWQDPASGQVVCQNVDLPDRSQTGDGALPVTVKDVLARLPQPLRQRVESGELALASFGQTRHSDSVLAPGERLELLTAIRMDARAARAARVKQVRARQRGPYNRSYSGPSGNTGAKGGN